MAREKEPYIVVHGEPRDCPRARAAFEASAEFAERIKKDGVCMACGKNTLRAIPRAKE